MRLSSLTPLKGRTQAGFPDSPCDELACFQQIPTHFKGTPRESALGRNVLLSQSHRAGVGGCNVRHSVIGITARWESEPERLLFAGRTGLSSS